METVLMVEAQVYGGLSYCDSTFKANLQTKLSMRGKGGLHNYGSKL